MTRGIFHQGYFNADPYNYLEVSLANSALGDSLIRGVGYRQFRNVRQEDPARRTGKHEPSRQRGCCRC
jgi:hypothetical protein